MTNIDPHTVKAFDDDLEQIRALIAEMGGLVEVALERATGALIKGNELEATMVVVEDGRIDSMSEDVERQCIRLVALRAPMADDLREILSAYKVAIIVERMGDCARTIAEQVPMVRGLQRRSPQILFERMSLIAAELVRLALDAFVTRDAAAALRLQGRNDGLDALHDDLLRDLLETMTDTPSTISASTCLLFASQKLERLGAHAANVAKAVHFSTTGERLPHSISGSRAAAAD